jgi:3-hydroxyisobutyrate dehydrogenase-like beta-hydroxyacid dehydrogenase
MVGGKPAAFEKVKPLFEKMGKSVTLIGGSGAGQVAKACNQILTGVGVMAVAEAFNFAAKSGVDAAKVREALLGGFAYSARSWRTTASACSTATSSPASRPGCTRRTCASSWKRRTAWA